MDILELKKISNGVKILIYQGPDKQRLDKFLTENLLELPSRSLIQKAIKGGQIKVNGKTVTPHWPLKHNDQIEISLINQVQSKPKVMPEPTILKQTEDYLVIDKPAGLVIHPAEGISDPTLTDWLLKKFPQIKKIGEDPLRPGIVHRLDKEVSGLVVVALSQAMFVSLKKQFQEHQIKKNYRTLVYGKIIGDEGRIDFPVERSEVTGKIVAKPRGLSQGREAITNFLVLKRFSRYTFLEVEILTGRTHQIRVHFQAYGYPIVGDKLYFNKKIKDNLKLKRLFLHACRLGFFDLANQWQEFTSALPDELNNLLNNLK